MVRWFAEIVEEDEDAVHTRKIVGVHYCTAADRAKFFQPNLSSKKKIEKLFAQEKMFCLDSTDWNGKPLELFGPTDVLAHRRLDIIYMPCEPKQLTRKNRRKAKKECLVNLKSKKALKRRL
jgi:hypothetical protein